MDRREAPARPSMEESTCAQGTCRGGVYRYVKIVLCAYTVVLMGIAGLLRGPGLELCGTRLELAYNNAWPSPPMI